MTEIKLVGAEAFAPRTTSKRKVIVIAGSSTWANYGATVPANGVGGLLTAALLARYPGCIVYNISVAGRNTDYYIDNFNTDIAALRPTHIIFGTGIVNEAGYAADKIAAHKTYAKNSRTLAALALGIHARPYFSGIYPYNSNYLTEYQAGLVCNHQLELMGHTVFDFMSTLDDGTGKFTGAATFTADGQHVNDAGALHYFSSIPLSAFDDEMAPNPVFDGQGAWELGGSASTKAMFLQLSSATSSWAIMGRFKSKSGVGVAAVLLSGHAYGQASAPMRAVYPTTVVALNDTSGTIATSTYDPTTDFNGRELVIYYNAARNKAGMFVDGVLVAENTPAGTPGSADLFSWMSRGDLFQNGAIGMAITRSALWRSPLSASKIASMSKSRGRIPSSSLAYYGEHSGPPGQLVANLAPTSEIPSMSGASAWSFREGNW